MTAPGAQDIVASPVAEGFVVIGVDELVSTKASTGGVIANINKQKNRKAPHKGRHFIILIFSTEFPLSKNFKENVPRKLNLILKTNKCFKRTKKKKNRSFTG
jgi:hypothetical protein